MADGDDHPNSPPRNYRIQALRDFLPLSEEASMSTRGQNLPGIIQSRSSSNLASMRARSYQHTRRRSSFGAEDLSQQRTHDSSEMDSALGLQGQVLSSMSNWSGGEDAETWSRRLSIPASLIRPEMRSQRLIGTSRGAVGLIRLEDAVSGRPRRDG